MNLGPKLREDLVLVEQVYRGERSFIVKDPATRKYFRFRPLEVMVMQALDGEHTAEEAAAGLRAGGVGVSAATLEGFARKLKQMGLLERTLAERSVLELERLRAERGRRRRRPLFKGELLRLRWSFGDPDAFMTRSMPHLRFLFTRAFILVSLALFVAYFAVLALRWPEFRHAVGSIGAAGGGTLGAIVLFWATGLVTVIIHELGHGFACKHFGGEVHEMGAMLIYLQPAFYCNVNDAWTFPDLGARLWVTAAGSWIQFVLAGAAAIVWWVVQPGTVVSQIAIATVLIGGITTVLANVNPLIPLDGYYALSDWLEIPNLRHRAFLHLGWFLKTRVLRLDLPEPPADARERRVFLIYAALAIVYIVTLMLFIFGALLGWVDRVFGGLGLALAVAGLGYMLRGKLRAAGTLLGLTWRAHRATWRVHLSRRGRRLAAGGVALLALGLLVPWGITADGRFAVAPTLDLPVTAPDSGFVAEVLVREGTRVPTGAPLVRLRSFALERERALAARAADSLGREVSRARAAGDVAATRRLEIEAGAAELRLAALDARRADLTLRARAAGVVTTPRPEELVGRWVEEGAQVLALGAPDSVEARVILTGAGAALVRPGQPARLVSYADVGAPLRTLVAGTATTTAGADTAGGALEARIRLPAAPGWRPGVTGEAHIRVRRASVLGALWWGVRTRLRTDLLL